MFSIKANDLYPVEFETVQVDEQGQVVERKQGRAFAFRESLSDEIGLEIVAIPGGKFMMGAPESEDYPAEDEGPQHPVTLQPFFMGKYPVTQAQWRAIANTLPVERELNPNPSGYDGDNLPIEGVFWEEGIEFCQRLSRGTERAYRLPTEAEWEYACRAGSETPFYFGKTITTDLANYRGTDAGSADKEFFLPGFYDRGPKGVYRQETTPVDTFPPNAFGLYDMHGNVGEWCLDHFHGSYEGAPTDGSAWVSGGDQTLRVVRGGSFNIFPYRCCSTSRLLSAPESHSVLPGSRDCTKGFRVVCEISRTP
jgi:formylglycine-generating enzyme required for sulfatase activity